MALGDQSKGLIQASKTRGWDPNIIPAGNGDGEVDISEFNMPPERPNFGDMAGRPLPGDVPHQTNGMPDGYDVSVGAPRTSFNAPDAGRENANRRTSGANPVPGMPGAE